MSSFVQASMQNQIDKDESYHRDEIAKLKSDFRRTETQRRQPNQFERPTAGRIDLTKKAEYEYKDALRDKTWAGTGERRVK